MLKAVSSRSKLKKVDSWTAQEHEKNCGKKLNKFKQPADDENKSTENFQINKLDFNLKKLETHF